MNRRSFLTTASSLALTQLLVGCNRADRISSPHVRLLKGSVPIQLLREFQRRIPQGQTFAFLDSEQLADLYALLQTWKEQVQASSSAPPRSTAVADLVTLGDYWLAPAIQQQLIQPLNLEDVAAWQRLADQSIWQTLVRRDRQGQPSPNGEIWAAPYRWGTLMMAYNVEEFESRGLDRPTDWSSLWQPELKRHISLLDSPRSVIGLTLKKLGRSINTENLEAVPNLQAELAALQQQVKVYSSDAYLQPLILGDTWLAVGWSTEILPIVKRDRQVAAVVPQSGTLLTADLWVQPATGSNLSTDSTRAELLNQWLNFCWEDQIATQISLLSFAASPLFFGIPQAQLPPSLQSNDLLLPSNDTTQTSEFLLPLSASSIDQYRRLWTEVRLTV